MTDWPRDTSILIVGAGPTGLTAAIELARRGYRPRIVDKDAGPPAESRALAVNPRTLQVLEPSGATARLVAAGRRIHHAHFHTAEREFLSLKVSDLGGPYPFMLVLPQGEIEALLADLLGEHGIAVEWQTELTALTEADGRLRAELKGPGRTQRLRPDIVIGADGAHSTVRRAIGLAFPGSAYETEWGLADVEVRTKLPLDGVHAFDLAPVLFAMIPIRGNLVRLISDQPDVLAHVPPEIAYGEVAWLTSFRISHRQTETYQAGNVFLAGDAAHIHSPFGGRGMNLGIEDAAWLAWQIAEGRTDNYTKDRRPVGRHVLRTVDPATRLMAADGLAARLARRRLLPLLFTIPALRRLALRRLAGQDTPFPPWLRNGAAAPRP
ncbi:MAG TPA: FAD-dependent oxidoreductase [Afifellaceae bacterium]|nr:FAD-dependent oxidoreductase [Afifellaceae bacterium]